MKKISVCRLALTIAFLIGSISSPLKVSAATTQDDSSVPTTATTTTNPSSSAKAPTTVSVKKLPASDTTATSTATAPAVSAPQATTPTPTTPKTADVPTPGSVTVGDLTVSHARVVYKKDHLDFFCSIKNISNADERLGGAGTPLSTGDVVMVTKDKDGKETEAPVGIILTADKTVDLSTDTSWIRIKDVKSEPKSSEIVPVTLYFRRSPNAVLKLTLSGSEGSSLLDWFKK